MSKAEELIKGYGKGFPPLEELFNMKPSEAERLKLESPIPALDRYLDSVKFLADITSGRAISLKRFYVIKDYFLQLRHLLTVEGLISNEDSFSHHELEKIMKIGTTVREIYQAQLMEKFTDHDTAAAIDFVKLRLVQELPELEALMELIGLAITSEDTMGNVYGLILNELVYGYFIPALLDFCDNIMAYADKYETDEPQAIPEFTHDQAAEVTTLGKKFMTRLKAIDTLIKQMVFRDDLGCFMPFSGKLGGAIGDLKTHFAAYQDVDWPEFARFFVENQGLYYEEMTDQCVSYVIEASHFSTIANILTQVVKFTNDFISMASTPAQFFVKRKKAGEKGSSIMPNKSNAWGMEGGVKMLLEARERLFFLCKELPNYPHAGNMGRSYLMRNIGDVFMPIFIALNRITGELNKYQPNQAKIQAFFHEYPGMCGSVLQTVMKRQGISGDAYRTIQDIAINPDGTYANSEQFKSGLEIKMQELNLPPDCQAELRRLLDIKVLVAPADRLAKKCRLELMNSFENYREDAKRIINRLE